MCDLSHISRNGYSAWRTRPVSEREMTNQHLLYKIKAAYEANRSCYGSLRIYHKLKDEMPCSANRVARLMQQDGICAKQSKRYKTTTQRNENHSAAPNHLGGTPHARQVREVDASGQTKQLQRNRHALAALCLARWSRSGNASSVELPNGLKIGCKPFNLGNGAFVVYPLNRRSGGIKRRFRPVLWKGV